MSKAPEQAEPVAWEAAAQLVEDGYRCRSCEAVFIGKVGHPDTPCPFPSWDRLSEEGTADAIRCLAAPQSPASGDEVERARIVAWLRERPTALGYVYEPRYLADAIERGDHLT